MHKYYILQNLCEPEDIGLKTGEDQVEILRHGFDNPKYYDLLVERLGPNYLEFKHQNWSTEFKVQYAKLREKAFLTDVLSYSPFLMNCKFMISARLKHIFEEFTLCQHMFIPTTVYRGQELHHYYLLKLSKSSYDIIDFPKSIFSVQVEGFNSETLTFNRKRFSFSSAEEMLECEKDYLLFDAETLCFKEKFDRKLDLFTLYNGKIIISERLFERLVSENISGLGALPVFGDVTYWPKLS